MGKSTSTVTPLATHHHEPGGLDQTLEFLKRTRSELRQLRWVFVGQGRLRVCDVNGDAFEIVGLGYADPDVIPLLNSINTAYDPQTLHLPTAAEFKEFKLGCCHPWAEDRVM
ncbi:MAG TPA: hypothetical protein VKF17_03610 [Isosphaeraceae bacterium]|nr:hypothetical protein [Isosphaeraceae bacterium]